MNVKVLNIKDSIQGKPSGLQACISPEDFGTSFALCWVVSGVTHAELTLGDGQVAFGKPIGISDGFAVVVPSGARLRLKSDIAHEEATVFWFDCPDLKFYPSLLRYGLKCPNGSTMSVSMSKPLSAYETAVARPMVARTHNLHKMQDGSGRQLYGQIAFEAILACLFSVPMDMEYWGRPANVLLKAIEADPLRTKVADMARKLKCTASGLSKSVKKMSRQTPSWRKRQQTLHFARYYILKTQLPFKNIAKRIGFSTATYFSRYVRERTGKTPREIRAAGKWPI